MKIGKEKVIMIFISDQLKALAKEVRKLVHKIPVRENIVIPLARVPAAHTGVNNITSRATLIKAGFKVAGFILLGNY
jgi:hypothetical protein